jgi:GNAT superfamily N-acetyltransferase
VIIRLGAPHERAMLEDLQRRAALTWDNSRDYLLANPDMIDLPLSQLREGTIRVAEQDDRPVGFAVLLPRDGFCELDGLYVEPALHGRGIGRALVTDALRQALAVGIATVEANANLRAVGFYRTMGFTPLAPAKTPFGPAQRMRISAFSA